MTHRPLRFLALLESCALLFGLVLSLAAWWWTLRSEVALAALLGSLFSSGNLRLLIWNWSPMLETDPPPQVAEETHSQPPPTQNIESSATSAKMPTQDIESSVQNIESSTQDTEPSAKTVEEPAQEADGSVLPMMNSFSPVQRSLLLTGRFLFKHLFLLGGLILCLWGLKLHVAGFSLGLGNIVIAILFSPLLPQSTE